MKEQQQPGAAAGHAADLVTVRAAELPLSLRLQVGEVIAERFVVEQLAGVGGMGAVYRGRDLRSELRVALKVIAKDKAQRRQRFEREASLLAEVRHPAVVRYIAHGRTGTGTAFLAMEWLEGEDLSKRLARGPLDVDQSLALLRRAAAGLACAHALGIVHRDIKPSNLFLPHGSPDGAKLIDFGLARNATAPHSLTRDGVPIGTVGYMAPEQAMGADDVDARADVFALGCVLFECLTGRPPFYAAHDVAVLAKVLCEEPPRASDLCPELDRALDGFLTRLLAKQPAGRPRDAAALLKELDDLGELTHDAGAPNRSGSPPPARAHLSSGESRIMSVILGRPVRPAARTLAPEQGQELAARLDALALQFDTEPVPMTGGSLLFVLRDDGSKTALDLAAQAARCALRLAELRPELQLSIGTGRLDVSGLVPIGAAIDRAASLLSDCGAGPAGGILVDELTAGLLARGFDLRAAHAGLILQCEHESSEPARRLMGKPTPHVGRDKESALLDATLAECRDERVARVVLVTAQPGFGKSRLASEFVERVRMQNAARVLVARADSTAAGSAFALATQLIRQAARLSDAGQPPRARSLVLREYLSNLVEPAELEHMHEFLSQLLDLPVETPSDLLRCARSDPEVMREQLRRAFSAWLAAESGRSCLVVILEDLHWGDLPSVSCLEHALRTLADRSLLVLALARPEVHDCFPKLWARIDAHELKLSALTQRASEQLAQSVLGSQAGAEALIRRVVALGGGNAFFLEELIRCVAEGDTELPESVLALAQSRLARSSPEQRRILRAASVFGETCWEAGIAFLLGNTPALEGALHQLVDEEYLVQKQQSRIEGEREFVFRHAFLREAAYATLTADDRCTAHRLAGEWLELVGRTDERMLADHFERGAAPERAIPYLVRAACTALEAGDLEAAMVLSNRGIALGVGGAQRGLALLVRAYASAYRTQTDIEGLSDALELLPRASAHWWLALSLLAFGSLARGRPADAQGYLELALATEPGSELNGVYGQALKALAVSSTLAGRSEQGWALIEPFRDLSVACGRCDQVFLAWLNLTRCELATSSPRDGRWILQQALHWGRESVAGMRSAGSQAGLESALFWLANTCRLLGLYADAEPLLVQCTEITQSGNVLMKQFSELILALVTVKLGRPAEARERLRALAASQDGNVTQARCAVEAEAHYAEGHFEQSLVAASAGIAGPSTRYRRMLQGVLARSQLALGDAAAAVETCRSGLGPGVANLEYETDLRVSLAEGLHQLEQRSAARDVLREARAECALVADSLTDPELRHVYFGAIAANARMLRLAQEWELDLPPP